MLILTLKLYIKWKKIIKRNFWHNKQTYWNKRHNNKLTENEKYYIKLRIENNKNIGSINTNWDEFENNKKIMKDIRRSFDEKRNYIMLYLQVILQND